MPESQFFNIGIFNHAFSPEGIHIEDLTLVSYHA